MSANLVESLEQGKAIVARMGDASVSKALAPHLANFKSEQDRLQAAADKVEAAREARDKALETVGRNDDTLDASLPFLADRLVGAGLGSRKNAFAGFSKYSPSAMADLPYVTEAAAVHDLVKEIGKKKPLPGEVQKAVNQCEANATAVEKSLKGLIGPQAAFNKAMGDRDALLPGWQKALTRLKKHAAAEWSDEVSTYKAVFAAPDRLQRPVKKRKKKAVGVETPVAEGLLVAAAGGEPEGEKVEGVKAAGAKKQGK